MRSFLSKPSLVLGKGIKVRLEHGLFGVVLVVVALAAQTADLVEDAVQTLLFDVLEGFLVDLLLEGLLLDLFLGLLGQADFGGCGFCGLWETGHQLYKLL